MGKSKAFHKHKLWVYYVILSLNVNSSWEDWKMGWAPLLELLWGKDSQE